MFDTAALAALPPPQSSDLPWLREWSGAANRIIRLIILFGAKPGQNPDRAALARNLIEYEDQYAVAAGFVIRIEARQAIAMSLFLDQLTPDQLTPMREAGLQMARDGPAKFIADALTAFSQGAKPANARLVTAAMRDTGDVWAAFLAPDDRTRIATMIRTDNPKAVKDDEVHKSIAAFAAALAAAKQQTAPSPRLSLPNGHPLYRDRQEPGRPRAQIGASTSPCGALRSAARWTT